MIDVAGLAWRKSSRSMGQGECVEVAPLPGGGCAVRDSQDREGAWLAFSSTAWRAFLARAKADAT